MGENSEESEVFGVSREVTNWTTAASAELLDYGDSWSAVFSNASINGSVEANKTSSTDFKRDEELAKVEMAVLALIFILTVLGNFIVLLGIFFRRQKMTRMYYFILHLSVADLITAFFNVLTQLFWEITYRFQGGNVLCKFVKYTQILGPYSSSYVLVMTALDRYQAICYPLSNCTWTARRSKVMLGLAWAISLLFSAPQTFIFSYQIVQPGTDTDAPVYDCWATFPENWGAKAYVTWYSITVFIIPLIILVFAYSCITRAIWINFNMKAASRNHDMNERRIVRADSDDGEGPSNHSQDESVFHREGQLSLRANASHTISDSAPSKKSNINLYSLSKHSLTTRSSTSSASGVENCATKDTSRKKYRDQGKKSVNNRITTRTSTSSCTTQSSITLSPSLSSRRMSVPDDKGSEANKNPLCFTSHKMFTSQEATFNNTQEEQLQLLRKEPERNELGSTSATDKNDLEGNGTNGNGVQMKNGSVKFSGASDICQHGCSEKRCNFCHLSPNDHDRRYSTDGTNLERKDSILNKALVEKQTSPEREKQQNQIYRFAGKSSARHLLLPTQNRLSKKGRGGSYSSTSGGNQGGKQSTKSLMATSYVGQQPRTHSVKGISRAKIKTIKLTVTIICCYIFCSSPFIAAQLWSVYDPYAMTSPFFSGPTFTILTLLASLNSCVNPYIFLFFNPNLLENCFRGIFRPKFPARRFNNGGSPLSRTMSQSKKVQLGVTVVGGSLGAGGVDSGKQ
ncbi:[Arg8]-vasotocin receptor [Orchesella cincta]|uniref:[Arg8]-vasotocin receptor n=1 Tax=Orchesella cincta TaxID=48709 RepID=A0A1D2MU07_ORCCI|nr:[Arg8]-vasotocin receptor [Orchesella cincta]